MDHISSWTRNEEGRRYLTPVSAYQNFITSANNLGTEKIGALPHKAESRCFSLQYWKLSYTTLWSRRRLIYGDNDDRITTTSNLWYSDFPVIKELLSWITKLRQNLTRLYAGKLAWKQSGSKSNVTVRYTNLTTICVTWSKLIRRLDWYKMNDSQVKMQGTGSWAS